MIESWVGAMSTLLPRAIREAGHRFTFLTRDLHHYLRAGSGVHPLLTADNVLTAETNDLDGLLPQVERLHSALGFDGVISSCDYYLTIVARVAAHLGLPGPDPDAVERANRKDLTRQALHAAGVSGPRFALARNWPQVLAAAADLGYPLVAKPVDLCAGMYVRKVADEGELREAFLAMDGFPVNARQQPRTATVLLEEVLTGPEVSVETVTFDGVTHVVGITDKNVVGQPWFVESGHMFPADLPADQAAEAATTAVAALDALGLDRTVAHTEIKITPGGPRVVEVNPRPAGNQITELVRRVTGIDLPMAYAQLAVGQRPRLEPSDTGASSAAIAFLLPPRRGIVAEIAGAEEIGLAPDVVDCGFKPSGHRAADPSSNNAYLGHVMVVDRTGPGARRLAEELLAGVEVRFTDAPSAQDARPNGTAPGDLQIRDDLAESSREDSASRDDRGVSA